MPTQNRKDRFIPALLAFSLAFIIYGVFFACFKYLERHPPPALVPGTVCSGGLFNYSCKEDSGCSLTYVGHKLLRGHVAEKAVSCIRHCQQACCEDGGDPRCFSSCCDCLDGGYDALVPLVQPPL